MRCAYMRCVDSTVDSSVCLLNAVKLSIKSVIHSIEQNAYTEKYIHAHIFIAA